MKLRSSLIYYITAHGYGHGVRSCDIINALRRTDPELNIRVVSDLPVDFLRSRLDLPIDAYCSGSIDVGMSQVDSIRVDVEQTLRNIQSLLTRRAQLIAKERGFLRDHHAGLVVCDIPAMPIEAARAEGIPAIAVGNFAWDWIYEEFIGRDKQWREVVDVFRSAYRQTDLLLQLPFSEPMAAFPRRLEIPLVSSPGLNRRADLASSCNIDPAKKWVLLSFSTLEWGHDALRQVESLSEYVFLTVRPLEWPGKNFRSIDRHQVSFSDVIASCDFVVSKPGYGILSECVVNEKPLVYAERTDFREYPILEKALKKYLKHQHIPAVEIYRGNLAPYLDAIQKSPPATESLNSGGDVLAAARMLEFLR
jgi:L-arabinokinase